MGLSGYGGSVLPLSVLVWIAIMVVYHAFGFGFEVCDRKGLLGGAKVRRADRLSYANLLPRVVFNQVFVLLPSMVAVQWLGVAYVGTSHLGPGRFILDMLLMGVGHDIVQYASHRYVLHHPRLMRRLGHAVHHSTGASKAISACYMSAPDFFLEIVLPYLLPLVLVGGGGSDLTFQVVVAGLGAFGGLYEHSGYDFAVPLRELRFFKAVPMVGRFVGQSITSKAHGEHHRRFNVSFSDGFGSPGICDTLFSTRWDKVKGASVSPRSARSEKPSTTLDHPYDLEADKL